MKRLWFGVGLLAVIVVLGILLSSVMERSNRECSELLYQAADRAMADDWENARILTDSAREKWQKNWAVTASLADHQPMDDIDALFAELEIYLRAADPMNFSGTGAKLASLLDALSQSHQLKLWNLLSSPLPAPGFPQPALPPR